VVFRFLSQFSPSGSVLQQNALILFGSNLREARAFLRKSPVSREVIHIASFRAPRGAIGDLELQPIVPERHVLLTGRDDFTPS
jgi:hypothetical protein